MRRSLLATRGGRAVVGALVFLVVAVVVGLFVLWPSGDIGKRPFQLESRERATVTSVTRQRCPEGRGTPCQVMLVELRSGPQIGQSTYIGIAGPEAAPEVAAGDKILVYPNDPTGQTTARATDMGVDTYSFADFERRRPLLLFVVAFALLAIVLARAKGARALVGLGLSLVVVTQFIVPAILEGSSALAVAVVGSLAVMLVTIGLAHGGGVTSLAAILGGAVTLVVIALLAILAVETVRLTGFQADGATLLRNEAGGFLSVQGLVLAGMLVGALGVLDDVTVSQASTVLALRRANPAQSLRRLFSEGLAVGRDHLSATINTLVLAYAGAALPLLLILEVENTTFSEATNSELIATEIIAMLVGSMGLMLAVPLTTALAAWLSGVLPPALLPDEHAHAHHH